ncbi:MAG: hypothetical protein EA379_12070 [Phycisphaerales bacterium]|nr:MAG: hypothetical protein EA379_12070 [Phycisphaerales bacterium]
MSTAHSTLGAGAETGGTHPARAVARRDHLLRYGDEATLRRLWLATMAPIVLLILFVSPILVFMIPMPRGVGDAYYAFRMVAWTCVCAFIFVSLFRPSPVIDRGRTGGALRLLSLSLAVATPTLSALLFAADRWLWSDTAAGAAPPVSWGSLLMILASLWIALGALTLRRMSVISRCLDCGVYRDRVPYRTNLKYGWWIFGALLYGCLGLRLAPTYPGSLDDPSAPLWTQYLTVAQGATTYLIPTCLFWAFIAWLCFTSLVSVERRERSRLEHATSPTHAQAQGLTP